MATLGAQDLFESLLPEAPAASGGVSFAILRELSGEDLGKISLPSAVPQVYGAIKRLRPGHHEVARLLAKGLRPGDVSRATGYGLSRISILQADPMFQELMAYYQSMVDEVFQDDLKALAILGKTAVEELQERMEATPETFGNVQLLKVAEMAYDRAIAPANAPQRGGQQGGGPMIVNINFVKPKSSEPIMIDVSPERSEG